ncbi:MAG: thiamine diphosphokinase [Clostridia bacterium]|nr:thiamine diphosphokinase [Clostridia bacterium]
MKGILLLNGEPYPGAIPTDDAYTICCDGAYRWAKDRVHIDETIGDMDSAGVIPSPAPKAIYPTDKDYTDGELGLAVLMRHGCSPILIYGGSGGREDHFIGNLHLLYKAHSAGIPCAMISGRSLIFPMSGRTPLGRFCGKTLSVLPFSGDISVLSWQGLKYPYPEKISYGECRGISNICTSVDAYLDIQGTALIIVSGGD